MPRTISAAALPSPASERAHKLNSQIENALDSIAWATRMLAKPRPYEGPAYFEDAKALARKAIAIGQRQLGHLLLDEDPEEGDRLVVGPSLYELRRTGGQTTVMIAGQAERCDEFVAVHIGDAPLPGHDDEADDELAERASEYHAMTFAG